VISTLFFIAKKEHLPSQNFQETYEKASIFPQGIIGEKIQNFQCHFLCCIGDNIDVLIQTIYSKLKQ